jgi:hypothetical protein
MKLAAPSRRLRAPHGRSRLSVDGERIDAEGALGVFCGSVLAIARHRPWLAVVVVVAAIIALVTVAAGPREVMTRLLAAL